MPSYRKPKGVRVLTTGDWFYQNAAAGGGTIVPGGGNDALISLYNNTQIGEWLWVFNISGTPLVKEYFWYYQIFGTQGTFSGKCYPVVSGNPDPIGQIFLDTQPPLAEGLGTTFPMITEFESPTPASQAGPLAVVKPGYSLIARSNAQLFAGFNYLVLGN